MAGLIRDFLQLIAEQIDDPHTFYQFSQVCRYTAGIARLLKTRKKNEFFPPNIYVPFQFWFNRNPDLALPLIALNYHTVGQGKTNILPIG